MHLSMDVYVVVVAENVSTSLHVILMVIVYIYAILMHVDLTK